MHASPFSPSFTVWGPTPINPSAVQRVNSTLYHSALPPVNYSLPILRLAGVITLQGEFNTLHVLAQSTYAWLIDSINMRGGVTHRNQSYLLQLTWTSDDSALAYLNWLYDTWAADPSIAVLLAPPTDAQLVSILPVLLAYNRTIVDVFAGGLAEFGSPRYPYAWYPLLSNANVPGPILSLINAAAVLSGATSSPFGLTTICLYVQQDESILNVRDGVLAWLNATNTARLASSALPSDLLTLVVDVAWPSATTYPGLDPTPLFELGLQLCPDDVDLLIHLGAYTAEQFGEVAQAMAAVQLRPKAAYSFSTATDSNPGGGEGATTWVGWMTQGVEPVPMATLPAATFPTVGEALAAYTVYFNTSGLPTRTTLLFAHQLEVLKAALTTAASLSSDDLRAAFLSLNGSSFLTQVRMDPDTGTNPGAVPIPGQLTAASVIPTLLTNPAQMLFPFDWPWRRVQVGDPLTYYGSPPSVIYALVLCVVGLWAAQILLEQTVFLRRKGAAWQPWLLMVAFTFGGVGVCCCQLEYIAASTFTLAQPPYGDPTGASLAISYSLAVSLIALFLPGFLCSLAGFTLIVSAIPVIGALPTPPSRSGKPPRVGHLWHDRASVDVRIHAEERAQIVLSMRQRAILLLRHVTPRFVAGMLLIDASIWCTRLLLTLSVWRMDAKVAVSREGSALSLVVTLLVLNPSLLAYCHAVRHRLVGVAGLVVAVYVDFQNSLANAAVTYHPWAQRTHAAPGLYAVTLPTWALEVFTGIIGAASVFLFLGLQFSRLQLSRNGLTTLIARQQAQLSKLAASYTAQTDEVTALRGQADTLVRMLEVINMVRPEGKEFALALAQHVDVASMQRDMLRWKGGGGMRGSTAEASKLTSPRSGPAPSVTSAPPTMRGQKEEGREDGGDDGKTAATTTKAVRPSLPVLPRVQLGRLRHRGSSSVHPLTASSSTAREDTAVLEEMVELHKQSTARGGHLTPVVIDDEEGQLCLVNGGLHAASSPAPPTHRSAEPISYRQALPPLVNSRLTPSRKLTRTDSLSSLLSSSALHADDGPSHINPATDSPYRALRSLPSMSQRSTRLTTVLSRQWGRAEGGGARQFESDVLTSMAALSGEEFPLPSAVSVQSPTGMEALMSPGGGSRRRSAEVVWVRPTLLQLLHHPVCVELLKDEVVRLQCAELLTFYRLATRYRGLQSAKLRRLLAVHLHDAFIAEGSEQQLNLSTRQREAIVSLLPALRKGDEGAASPSLFADAEAEALQLMEVNVMKGFMDRKAYRLCVWAWNALSFEQALCMVDGRQARGEESREDSSGE